jgi:uncharacterized protein
VSGLQRHRTVAWDKEDGYGVELVDVDLGPDRLAAQGVAIGWDPVAFHLEFRLETGLDWVTSALEVRSRGDGWRRTLELRRSDRGAWTIEVTAAGDVDLEPPGGDPAAIADALDCDLGNCPLTNTMPVLRHDLLRRDGSLDFVMAFVTVPGLVVRRSGQRYTPLGAGADGLRRIEYRSLDSSFVSELSFDADGLCVDYPQLGRMVAR